MSNGHTTLDAAATERKARLAKLASLKRKRPGPGTLAAEDNDANAAIEDRESSTDRYISGRNFDISTKGPKLGFEQQPTADQETVEEKADRIAAAAAVQAAKDEVEAEKGIDLFKLQPKKANWDLKRDLAERTKALDVRTQNAIAKLVRERIQKAKEEAQKQPSTAKSEEGEELGVEGNTLVEAVHLREKEDEEDRRRQEDDEEDEEQDIP
ncbi:hypothetical protein LTR70_002052 [Exophiala xenobiotica]|uniref:Uncharacterized protein n=1 Tax=Lithohypha guttulata TaxID=1690604 RepID=A0ABR0KBI0_9EURO|nr:hypothetical protein LTR24_004623 [Lithohypha guttulata]KAK5326288.1 hypothetical protein LTR70_002052 [Exophiala xenobiotica]